MPALLRLSSPDFEDGAPIPERCAHHKDNQIPTLQWSDVPEGTVELAILMEDPDTPVGTWDHWAIAGINPATRSIEGGKIPEGAVEGRNDFGENGYGGPEPPPGDGVHRYCEAGDHLPKQIRACRGQLLLQPAGRVHTVRCGHRDDSSQRSLVGSR